MNYPLHLLPLLLKAHRGLGLLCCVALVVISCNPLCAQFYPTYQITSAPLGGFYLYNGPLLSLAGVVKPNPVDGLMVETSLFRPLYNHLYYQDWERLRGFAITAEYRRYQVEEASIRKDVLSYTGFELTTGKQAYFRTDSIDMEDSMYAKRYALDRKYVGLSINQGFETVWRHRWVFQFHFGIGLRYNMVKSELTEIENDARSIGDWTNPAYYAHGKGNHVLLRFNFGLRLGYQLFDRKATVVKDID